MTNPIGRGSGTGATDGTNLFVFGGRYGSPTVFPSGHLSDELWKFDGTAWTDLTQATGNPVPREFFAITWDVARGRLVLFGGLDLSAAPLGDTWEWDAVNGWIQQSPAVSPTSRKWAAMEYEPTTQRSILFGGNSGSSYLNDTWAWDGTSWTALTPTTSPAGRGRHAMAYDLHRSRLVMFGGTSSNPVPRSDTWEWDGTDWAQIITATTPYNNGTYKGCASPGMTYDPLRSRIVMVGGYDHVDTPGGTNDLYEDNTWEYDGVDWVDRGTFAGFLGRGGPWTSFVPALGKTYSFGGFSNLAQFTTNTTFPQMDDQVYEYQTNALATFTSVGTGCATSLGVPSLTAVTLPWLGENFTMEVDNVPVTAAAVLTLGATPASYSLSLLGIGDAACILRIDPAVVFLFAMTPTMTPGVASLTIPIPPTPALLGGSLLNQAFIVDFGPSRSYVSDRGDATLGAL